MTRYTIGFAACVCFALLYPYFRNEIFDELQSRGIRTRDIRHKIKGIKNFWLYTEVDSTYGLGVYGKLTRVYPIVFCLTVGFHIFFGWWDFLAVLDITFITLLTALCSVLILFTRFRINSRLFGNHFLLLGWHERKSKKGKLLEKNHYSTIFDIVYTVLPWIFFILMVWFEGKGL